jgi:hypothetical protein
MNIKKSVLNEQTSRNSSGKSIGSQEKKLVFPEKQEESKGEENNSSEH